MKKYIFFVMSFLLILGSCSLEGEKSKDEKNQEEQNQEKVDQIVNSDIQTKLKDQGVVLHTGENPPDITQMLSREAGGQMIYNSNDLDCYYDDTGYYPQNLNYYYRVYNQNGTEINMDFTNGYTDKGTSEGALIFGEGNGFTIYSTDKGIADGVEYTYASIYSGELTPEGIINFDFSFIMTDKVGDTDDMILMPIGAMRIYEEGDNLVEITSDYPTN